ncbi:MAG: ankyrin repeat domain-containing protein [Gammaproteobacteria bacterium]
MNDRKSKSKETALTTTAPKTPTRAEAESVALNSLKLGSNRFYEDGDNTTRINHMLTTIQDLVVNPPTRAVVPTQRKVNLLDVLNKTIEKYENTTKRFPELIEIRSSFLTCLMTWFINKPDIMAGHGKILPVENYLKDSYEMVNVSILAVMQYLYLYPLERTEILQLLKIIKYYVLNEYQMIEETSDLKLRFKVAPTCTMYLQFAEKLCNKLDRALRATVKKEVRKQRLEMEFKVSIAKGDLNSAQNLLLTDPDLVHITEKDNHTMLMLAANCGTIEVTKLLLENKIDISAQRTGAFQGTRAISYAIINCRSDFVRLLTEYKPSVINETCTRDLMPLQMAYLNAHRSLRTEIVKTILELGGKDF